MSEFYTYGERDFLIADCKGRTYTKERPKRLVIRYDPALKAELVNSGQFAEYRRFKRLLWDTDEAILNAIRSGALDPRTKEGKSRIYELQRDAYLEAEPIMRSDNWKVLDSMDRAKRAKTKRVRDYLEWMLSEGHLAFCTFTLSDDHLEKTQDRLRRVLRQTLQKASPLGFVYNQDYGEEFGRLHFHAVAFGDRSIDLSPWPYGYTHAESFGGKAGDRYAVAHYLCKLVAHAVKASTFSKRVYFDRHYQRWSS